MTSIVLTDDHALLRSGLAALLRNLGYNVLYEADNGKDFIQKLNPAELPDIVLMDINMPHMDGYETTEWIKRHHPKINVIALSMYDHENAIIRMLKCGAKGFILKDSHPDELKIAIESVMKKGFHYSDLVSGKLMHAITTLDDENNSLKTLMNLNEREIEFLKNTCTELTYKEIAEKMCVSPRTVDGYRDTLFEKLNIKTRVGLAMYAIKNNIVEF